MACNCNCIFKNGQDVQDFLIPAPGGTEANATYVLGLTHLTCGNTKLLAVDPLHPVECNLSVKLNGTPQDLGNGVLCQECVVAGTVTYKPCNSCRPATEYVSQQLCLPCSEATSPTITVGTVVASPKPINYYVNDGCGGCCQKQKDCTNKIAITTSINVTTGT